ncbi:hypothetical protein SADUNF_Sadunf05G0092500 [Salix dunnii]|uniref:Myb-like domain-containing protein n=1 Tax=Salix dunnii TaxID=1413687 RepID=A0A835N247_9ROSI|nr:hypothetical protein SADUNF_Sadunf05G0092500 [Salix dunnii]
MKASKIISLLEDFALVFEEPKALPLAKRLLHKIELKQLHCNFYALPFLGSQLVLSTLLNFLERLCLMFSYSNPIILNDSTYCLNLNRHQLFSAVASSSLYSISVGEMKSSSFPQPSSNWTAEQHKLFENSLAKYDKDTADRWRNIAKLVGETTEEEVKRRYDILLDDIKSIESDKVPLPNYKNEGGRKGNISSEEERALGSSSFPQPNSKYWSAEKTKLLETARPIYDKDSLYHWQNIARFVGEGTEEEVKKQYETLLDDISTSCPR